MLIFVLGLWVAVTGVLAQTPQLRTSNSQVRSVLDRIRNKSVTLQQVISRNSAYDTTPNAEERVYDQLTSLTNSVNSLRSSTYSRNADVSSDFNEILDRATRINRILSRSTTNYNITSQWTSIRTDLAGYYGVSWNWNQPYPGNNNGGYPGNSYPGSGPYAGGLTGTYRLNAARSDNVSDAIDRSLGSYDTNQRDRMRQNLERRLESPDVIAIEKRGRSITMASSNQSQVTFDADGIARTETNNRGRTITTRVSATNSNLTIDTSGDRVNDFNVTFDVDRSGRLRVTRRLYLENRNETISVSSIYDRTSQVADFTNIRPTNDPYGGGYNNGNNNTGQFYIPNGTVITATLRNTVSTKASQVGDRFTIDVTSPSQYQGAVIEGRVTQAQNSGRVTGKANLQLDFDTISYNGRTYQFAGLIQTVTATNGDNVSINNEGTIKDNSQTKKTVTRAGIGAVIGAVIGGIAGGGSGAAIGAGVGAGAGAGTVLLGGKDSIELGQGSTFTISSSSPANTGYIRNN